MPNDHIKSDISSYLSGDLPESRRREFEAHVAGCDSCRIALSKARAKQARHKRQALKDALPNPIPNLLVKRLDRQAGYNPEPNRRLQIWVGLVVAASFGGLAIYREWIPMHALVALKNIHPALPSPKTESAPPEKESPSADSAVPVASTETVAPTPAAAPAMEAAAPVAVPAPTEPEAPKVWSSSDNSIKEFRTTVVRGRTSWGNLWDEMGQPGTAPHVNFYDNLVVGVFAGARGGADAKVFLGSPQESDDEVVISYRITGTDMTNVSSTTVTGVSHPYSLSTIPRTTKKIRFSPES